MNSEDTKARSIETELRSYPTINYGVPSVKDGIERFVNFRLRVLMSPLKWDRAESRALIRFHTTYVGRKKMKNRWLSIAIVPLMVFAASMVYAGGGLIQCRADGPVPPSCRPANEGPSVPTCGIELTCTDKPVQLGYSDGVCFRATCPGVWALMHKRIDQASFRRRYFSYRHYAFTGIWELKGRGNVESGPAAFRELFLVMPDDLIEFKLKDPDPNALVEITNLGYIKRGSVEEMKRWLAYNIYLEKPIFQTPESEGASSRAESGLPYPRALCGMTNNLLSQIYSLGRCLGIPVPCGGAPR